MLGVAELLVDVLGKVLPASQRQKLDNRLLLARARARVSIPISETTVFAKSKENRKRFEKNLFAGDRTAEPESLPKYSLLITLRNEAESITELLDSILLQTAAPSQVVLCDGGSSDGTVSLIEKWEQTHSERSWELQLLKAGDVSIARGRNLAAREATEEIFLFTDAGVDLAKDWAELLLQPFYFDPETEVSMGWYRAICKTQFQKALAEFIVPNIAAIQPETFLPSARSLAVRRAPFFSVGGYPEHLTKAGEDSLFDFYLKTVVKKVAFCPDALSMWRMPVSYFSLARTIRGYARGDAEGGIIVWGYYLELLGRIWPPMLELLLAELVFWLGFATNSNLVLLCSAALGFSGLYRFYRLISAYGAGSGKVSKAYRLGAVSTLVINQALGFIVGYLERPAAERRRIATATKGHLLLLLPAPFVFAQDREKTELVERLLSDSWYLSCVTPDTTDAEGHVFAHPQFESHLRANFRFEQWFAKHEYFLTSKSREFCVLDLTEDSLSQELVTKVIELGAGKFEL